MEDYPRTLGELEARFATEQACREHLARLRWGQEFVCPACKGTEAWPTERGLWMCAVCGHQASAVRKAFRNRALVQRCQWHTRENVVRYLAKREQASWRQRLQRAYNRPAYDEALPALETLHRELEDRNQSAAGSLAEGLDETLTLHRLGLYGVLGRSLKTTNCLESINALVEERCAKVDHWQHSSQRHRWLATALLDIEPRLRKVMGYRHLPTLRAALKRELKIDTTPSKTKAA